MEANFVPESLMKKKNVIYYHALLMETGAHGKAGVTVAPLVVEESSFENDLVTGKITKYLKFICKILKN